MSTTKRTTTTRTTTTTTEKPEEEKEEEREEEKGEEKEEEREEEKEEVAEEENVNEAAEEESVKPVVQGDTEVECPVGSEDYFPHPTDCTKFYRCANEMRTEFTCKPGTHYHVDKHICDWPDNAQCKNKTV